MLIGDVTTSGALPALEMTIRFASQRQRLIADNVANFETPNYRPMDVSTNDFQRALGRAVDERRERNGGASGRVDLRRTREVRTGHGGRLKLTPRTPSDNILYHDRTNRDIERTMQDLVENAATFRIATELYAHQNSLLRSAISERP